MQLAAVVSIMHNAFYTVDYSKYFQHVFFEVGLRNYDESDPILEFRKVRGDDELFYSICQQCKNLLQGSEEKVLTVKNEEPYDLKELLTWLKLSPADAIEVVVKTALGQKSLDTVIMCNEVYNLIHMVLDFSDLYALLPRILGFIEVLKRTDCLLFDERHRLLLEESHRKRILEKLELKLRAFPKYWCNNSGSMRLRMERFLEDR